LTDLSSVYLVGNGLPVSEMTTVAYKPSLLLPAVDTTLAPGSQNVSLLAASLVNAGSIQLPTTQNLFPGAIINVYLNGSIPSVRLADCSTSYLGMGFVVNAVPNGGYATVFFSGLISELVGLTAGSFYYLGTQGSISTTAPASSGSVTQVIGEAITATVFNFAPGSAVSGGGSSIEPQNTFYAAPSFANGYPTFRSIASSDLANPLTAPPAIGESTPNLASFTTMEALWIENPNTITNSYVLPAGNNAITVGPQTIEPGVTVTINPGSVWKII